MPQRLRTARHADGHRARRPRRSRRPLTRLATTGMAAHVFFELGAGVGMPTASVIGPVPAAAAWSLGTATLWRTARTRPASSDGVFHSCNGMGLAAVLAHFAAWPSQRTRAGLPWLRDCEGLGPPLMPYYNPILYLSAAATVAALAGENRSAPRQLPLLAVALAPVLVAVQRAEHRRLKAQARERPSWWTRRLR